MTEQAQRSAKTIDDFKNAYHKGTIIPAKIKAGIASLTPNGWEYEVEFSKLCGVSLYDLGHFRDQFADNIVPINRGSKRVWAGSVRLAKQMKEML
jgi:hypothetical protein